MAITSIADIINPEVLADQIAAKFPDLLVLGNTDLVEVDTTFPLGAPGTQFKIPFWKRIGTFTDLAEGTAMTPGKIQTNAEFSVVRRGGVALEVTDQASLVSKADPVGEISDQLARRAAEYIDQVLVAQANHTPNTFFQWNVQTPSTQGGSASTLLNQNAVIAALVNTIGDNFGAMLSGGAIICHSKVYGDLVQTGAIQNQYQSGMDVVRTGLIPTLMGLPIFISDLVTTSTISTHTAYDTYIVGRGALALFYQRQVMVEFDRDVLKLSDIISSNVHFAAHLFGYDENTAAVVAEQNKSIHVVQIVSY